MKEITVDMLNELACNEAFVDELKTVETDEAYLEMLGRYGVEITAEQLAQGIAEVEAVRKAHEEELNEANLEMVAGGFNSGLTAVGIVVGYAGLAVMMAGGPIGWWAAGSTLGVIGLVAPSGRNKKS